MGNPIPAVTTRIARRLLPSPSAVGLVEYGLVLPSKHSSKIYPEHIDLGGLEPILGKGEFGADVLWILHGGEPSSENSTDR